MSWEGALYINTTLPFSLRSAPKIFTALADAAEWIMRQSGVNFVLHYLDDYLVTGAPGTSECAMALRMMMSVFHRLGFPIAGGGTYSLLHLLGCLFFVRAYFQIDLLVLHLPGKENRVADAISRDNLPFLYSQVPGSQGWRSPISPALFDVLSSRHLNRTSRDWTRRFRDCIQQVSLRPPEGTTSRAYVVITPSAANSKY